MGIFAKLDGMEVKPDRGYLGEGGATIQLEKMFILDKRDGAQAFIAEFKVLESDSNAMPVGSVRSFYKALPGPFPELTLKSIHKLVSACCEAFDGERPDVNEELVTKVCGEDNPLAGVKLNYVGTAKVSQKNKPFTDQQFYPIND